MLRLSAPTLRRRPRLPPAALGAAGVAAVLTLVGCGTSPAAGESDAVEVAVAAYPFAYVAERVGGDRVEVVSLAAPGAEPHDAELTPRQVAALGEADVVVHLPAFQPAVDAAVEQDVDPAAVLEVEVGTGDQADPHVWLDPTRLDALAGELADRLADVDPAGADGYAERAAALSTELQALDADLAAGLADCERREFVPTHAAFGYLADRYDLVQLPLAGLSPHGEPSAAHLVEVQEAIRAAGVTTVFTEPAVSPEQAETLAGDLGLRTDVLDPVETEPAEGTYLDAMRANLAALQRANGCTT
jgi:zinc transport system substrate-binding protein